MYIKSWPENGFRKRSEAKWLRSERKRREGKRSGYLKTNTGFKTKRLDIYKKVNNK